MTIWLIIIVAALVSGLVVGWFAHSLIVALGAQDLATSGRLFYMDEAGRWYPKDPRE